MENKEDQDLLQEEEIKDKNLQDTSNKDQDKDDQQDDQQKDSKYPKTDFQFTNNLQSEANIISKILFLWMIKFVKKYKKFSFQQKNHYPLHEKSQVQNNQKQFEKGLKESKNLWWFLASQFQYKLFYFFVIFMDCTLTLLQVYLIYDLTLYLQYNETVEINFYRVGGELAAMVGIQLVSGTLEIFSNYLIQSELIMVKNSFCVFILKRVLKLQSQSPSQNFTGNIINLIQVDCQKFEAYGFALPYLIYTLVNLIFSFTGSFYIIGPTFGFYILTAILFMLISGLTYYYISLIELKLLKIRDERISLQKNVLTNIRYVKLNVMENFFIKYVYDFKKKELRLIKFSYLLYVFIFLTNWAQPGVSQATLFLTYFYYNRFLNLGKYMAVNQIILTVEYVFRVIPFVFNMIAKFFVTFKRIYKFLDIEQLYYDYQVEDQGQDYHLKVENGNFFYENSTLMQFAEIMKEDDENEDQNETKDDEQDNLDEQQEIEQETNQKNFQLKNLNFEVNKGEVLFVIGKIGSGKSSLAYALLGQLKKSEQTKVIRTGSISYCPQSPILIQKSIRENIVFNREFNKEKLEESIEMADLGPDLEEFDDGVEKLCNEDGLNLSGGQRLRVNLARCFYEESDIYLFDDPFSALDIHVSCKIIENSILGKLKDKTRIVITHSIQYLKYSDRILYLDEGEIQFQGSFEEFKQTQQFSNLEKTIKSQEKEEEENKRKQSEKFEEIKDNKKKEIKLNLKDKEDKFIQKYFLEEDKEEGRQLGLMIKLIQKYYGGIIIILLLIFIAVVPQIGFYYGLKLLYDYIYHQEEQIDQKWEILWKYTLIIIAPNFIVILRVLIQAFFQLRLVRKIHHQMMIYALHGSLLEFYDKIPIARLINRFSNDITNTEDSFMFTMNGVIISFGFLIFSGYVNLVEISYLFALIFLSYVLTAFYIQSIYIKLKKDIYRLENITKTPIVNQTKEIIEGRHLIKIFNTNDIVIKSICHDINENTKNFVMKISLDGWFSSMLMIFNILTLQTITFALSVYLLYKELISAKGFMIAILYLLDMIRGCRWFLDCFSELETKIIALERCDVFDKIPQEKKYLNFDINKKFLEDKISLPKHKFLPIKKSNITNEKFLFEEINKPTFKTDIFTKGKIEFKNVYAKYPSNEDYVLKNLNFEIKEGQKLGICGKTGSGKSTMIKLICQFLEQASGEILIDNYDIRKLDLKKLRSELLVISQEIALFNGTLLENLNPKYIKDRKLKKVQTKNNLEEPLIPDSNHIPQQLEEEIIQCLINFGFSKQKIKKEGLNFRITSGGQNLSKGEQQLVAIFRALFSDKKIIILDEATSAIDYETEKKIIDYFYEKVKGRTVISIAHRVNTIINSDQIILLSKGEILEKGTVDELLKNKDSHFKKMYDKVNQNLAHQIIIMKIINLKIIQVQLIIRVCPYISSHQEHFHQVPFFF